MRSNRRIEIFTLVIIVTTIIVEKSSANSEYDNINIQYKILNFRKLIKTNAFCFKKKLLSFVVEENTIN